MLNISVKHKKYICDRCLIYFFSNVKLNEHKINCEKQNDCKIEMPSEENKFLSFVNHKNELKIPFIVYADCETLLKEPEKEVYNTNCSTVAHQQHEAHSIGYYFKNENVPSDSYYASHRGPECVNWFISELKEIASNVFEILDDIKPMSPLNENELKLFNKAIICHICKLGIRQKEKVKDHCHLTGVYRGAAHQTCNLNYQITRNIPVVMHNLSGL